MLCNVSGSLNVIGMMRVARGPLVLWMVVELGVQSRVMPAFVESLPVVRLEQLRTPGRLPLPVVQLERVRILGARTSRTSGMFSALRDKALGCSQKCLVLDQRRSCRIGSSSGAGLRTGGIFRIRVEALDSRSPCATPFGKLSSPNLLATFSLAS